MKKIINFIDKILGRWLGVYVKCSKCNKSHEDYQPECYGVVKPPKTLRKSLTPQEPKDS